MTENGKFYRVGIGDSEKVDFGGEVVEGEPLDLMDKKGKRIGTAQIARNQLEITVKHNVVFGSGRPQIVESQDEIYALWTGHVEETAELEMRYDGSSGETIFKLERMDEDQI